jgi:hypothetical protein
VVLAAAEARQLHLVLGLLVLVRLGFAEGVLVEG